MYPFGVSNSMAPMGVRPAMAPMGVRPAMAPMGVRPAMAPMPSVMAPMGVRPAMAPTPMMGPTSRISDEVVKKQIMQIQQIDTSLVGMTRSFSDGVKFFKNLLNQRKTIEQNLIRAGSQPPALPKEVNDFLLTMQV
jgi:hypothetical protein